MLRVAATPQTPIEGTDLVLVECANSCGKFWKSPTLADDKVAWYRTIRCANAHESQRCPLQKARKRAAAAESERWCSCDEARMRVQERLKKRRRLETQIQRLQQQLHDFCATSAGNSYGYSGDRRRMMPVLANNDHGAYHGSMHGGYGGMRDGSVATSPVKTPAIQSGPEEPFPASWKLSFKHDPTCTPPHAIF